MRRLVAVLLVVCSSGLRAQTVVDPSGHWDGALQTASGMNVPFQVDLARVNGALAGTVTIPMQKLKGLPLLKVALDGGTLTFYARADQPLTAVLSPDGRTMAGDFVAGGASIPFTMNRIGDARIDPPARSAAVARELEGTWSGTLAVDGGLRLELTMANQPDGGALATIVNVDQGGLRVPVVITHDGAKIRIDSTVVASAFSGDLNADRTEIAGTFREGAAEMPMTFRRVSTKR